MVYYGIYKETHVITVIVFFGGGAVGVSLQSHWGHSSVAVEEPTGHGTEGQITAAFNLEVPVTSERPRRGSPLIR